MTEEQAEPLEVPEGELPNNYVVFEEPKKPQWRCPKCGRTDLNGWTWTAKGENLEQVGMAGTYCGICLMEWMAAHVPKMVEVGNMHS